MISSSIIESLHPSDSSIQSRRAFRRPQLGELELPGFLDWIRLTSRGADFVDTVGLVNLDLNCLRSASPAEATWKLGGCEIGDMQDESHPI